MRILAQVDNQGTAIAMTALCSYHHSTHREHFAIDYHDIAGAEQNYRKTPLGDRSWHDCTGNDELSCNVCGAHSDSADLVGKTVQRMEFGRYFADDDPNAMIETPSTTLFFTDGTHHTFIEP